MNKIQKLKSISDEYDKKSKDFFLKEEDHEQYIFNKKINKILNKIYKVCEKQASKGKKGTQIVLLNYNFLALKNLSNIKAYGFDYIFIPEFLKEKYFLFQNSLKDHFNGNIRVDYYYQITFPVLTIYWDWD